MLDLSLKLFVQTISLNMGAEQSNNKRKHCGRYQHTPPPQMSEDQVKRFLEAQRQQYERKLDEVAAKAAAEKKQEEAAHNSTSNNMSPTHDITGLFSHRPQDSEDQVKRLLEAQRQQYEGKLEEVAAKATQIKQEETANAAQKQQQEDASRAATQRKQQEEAAIATARAISQRKQQEEAVTATTAKAIAQRIHQEEAAAVATARVIALRKQQEEAAAAATAKAIAQRIQQEEAAAVATARAIALRKQQEEAAAAVTTRAIALRKQQEEAAAAVTARAIALRKQQEEAAAAVTTRAIALRKQQEEAAAAVTARAIALRKQQEEAAAAVTAGAFAERKQQEEAAAAATAGAFAERKQQEEVAAAATARAFAERKQQEEAAAAATARAIALRKQQEEAAAAVTARAIALRKQQEEAAAAVTTSAIALRKQQEEAAAAVTARAIALRKQQEEAAAAVTTRATALRKQQEEAAAAVTARAIALRKQQEEAAAAVTAGAFAERKQQEKAAAAATARPFAERKQQEEAAAAVTARAVAQQKQQDEAAHNSTYNNMSPTQDGIGLCSHRPQNSEDQLKCLLEAQRQQYNRKLEEVTAKAAAQRKQEEAAKAAQKQQQEDAARVAAQRKQQQEAAHSSTYNNMSPTQNSIGLLSHCIERDRAHYSYMVNELKQFEASAPPRPQYNNVYLNFGPLECLYNNSNPSRPTSPNQENEFVSNNAQTASIERDRAPYSYTVNELKQFEASAPPRPQFNNVYLNFGPLECLYNNNNPSRPTSPNQENEFVSNNAQTARTRNSPRERDVLDCPTCYSRYGMRIFQCESGHSSCNDCKIRGRACGICRMSLTNLRNYDVENHVAQTKAPCPHTSEGCQLLIKIVDMENHVKECPFKEQDCPLTAVFGTCRWKGKLSQISSHFEDMHPNGCQTNVDSEMQLRNVRNNSQQVNLIVLGAYNFLLHVKVSETDGKVYMAVQLIGTKLGAMKWLYEIHIYSKSENRRKYMYTDNCYASIDKIEDVFKAEECVVLPIWYANTFVCNSALTYKVFIKQTNEEKKGFGKRQRVKGRNRYEIN